MNETVTARLCAFISEHGEKAAIEALAEWCEARAGSESSHKGPWSKLAHRLRGALDGMKRGWFGRVG